MADPRPVNTGFDLAFGDSLRRFRAALAEKGIDTNIISGVRSPQEHQMAWDNFLAGKGPLPHPEFGPVSRATPPGEVSTHDVGLGADVKPVNPADLPAMYAMARQFGIDYLGASDPYHFQLANWQQEAARQPPQMSWSQAVAEAQRNRQQGDFATQYAKNVSAGGGPVSNDFTAPPGTTINSTGPARPSSPTPTQTTMYAGLNADARGMRNNNPGNLVANDWTKSLPGYKGTDGKFAIFDTPQHGALALDQNLAHYGTRGINTPLAIASTWAPASDNNDPNSYGARIAKSLGVGLNDKVDINDPTVRSKISQAIALVENGPGKSEGFAVGVPGATAAPAVASGATGTAAGAPPAGAGPFGGFKTQADADAFQKSAKGLEKAMGKGGGDAQGQSGPPDIQPSQMIGPPPSAMNVSPLLAMTPMTYGQTINSLQDPSTWYAPPGGRPQPRPQQGPMGASLNSLAAIDPNMTPFPQSPIQPMGYMGYGYPGGGMPYG